MIPVISVVASRSKTGKTTVVCKMVEILKARSYRVCVIKHHKGDFQVDQPGKDTWLHKRSGADQVVLSSPKGFFFLKDQEEDLPLDEITKNIKDVDIIITEGYKNENKPKIEVFRQERNKELISGEELFALVSDVDLDRNVPIFDFDNIEGLVDLVELRFLGKEGEDG